MGDQKSQKCDISPLCGGAPCESILTKFGVFVGLTNVIYAKNGFNIFSGFSMATGGKRMFPYRKPTAYITLPYVTALACDVSSKRHHCELIRAIRYSVTLPCWLQSSVVSQNLLIRSCFDTTLLTLWISLYPLGKVHLLCTKGHDLCQIVR